MTCRVCDAPLPRKTGPGRPAEYCGASCRKTAELELRRINLRLVKLEDRASDLRIELAGGGGQMLGTGGFLPDRDDRRRLERKLKAVTGEIERQAARLRALVGGEVSGSTEARDNHASRPPGPRPCADVARPCIHRGQVGGPRVAGLRGAEASGAIAAGGE